MSTFHSFTVFTQSLFYRLMHKTLSSNWIQIRGLTEYVTFFESSFSQLFHVDMIIRVLS